MCRIRQETKSVVNDAEAFNVAILGQGLVAALIVLYLKRWLEVLVWIVLGLISVECLQI
jgi:type IV secretory pathway TrbD component